ncbi:MAG TPA: hypothetical protein VFZ09_22090 [Archangium sp.]|uniref:hypothetical protein n=1 Tax=Archangium sp. TaxID=1872627 RepID=UPI002E3445AB|nr:hypothetical protein [Archangium sp.]HEX5748947.1 hypothetical protein [Archangium sp.]
MWPSLPAQGPQDALRAYQAHSLQQRLRWTEVDVRPPPRKQPRCAFLEGFSLHANTHLHENDRQGLELPQAGAEEASARLEVAARKEPMKEKTPRVDWAELLKRTFDFDVFKTQTAKTPSASRCTAGSSGCPGARRLRA